MVKQFFLIILLSLAAIFFKAQLTHVLDALVYCHNYIAKSLQVIFSQGHVGQLVQDMISLLIIPVLAGIVLALLFWLVKRTTMPHVMAVVWVLWLVLLATMVAQTGLTAPPRTNPVQAAALHP